MTPNLKFIELTHANLQSKMCLTASLIAGFYHSPAHACTHVVATGGAVFPATESVDEVRRLLNQAPAAKE